MEDAIFSVYSLNQILVLVQYRTDRNFIFSTAAALPLTVTNPNPNPQCPNPNLLVPKCL